jgi:hypothetical protein
MTSGQSSTAGVRERVPGSPWKGRASAAKTSRAATLIKTLLWQHRRHQWAPGPKRVSPWLAWAVPPSWTIFAWHHGRPSSGRTCRKIRWDIKPVGVPAGVRHRHHGSRWKHRCDGNVFSCRLVWTCPDLAHEPRPRIHLHLGRALRVVRRELRKRLPTTRCGGPPPCGEAGARGDSPEVHLTLHQDARYYTSYL